MTRLILFAVALVAGCGTPGADQGGNLGAGSTIVESSDQRAGGQAVDGAPCDYGGAARLTCADGLTCCYPETGDVAYGSCVADCGD